MNESGVYDTIIIYCTSLRRVDTFLLLQEAIAMVERGDATYQVKCITIYVENLFIKPIFYGQNKFVHAVLKPKFSILTFRATHILHYTYIIFCFV